MSNEDEWYDNEAWEDFPQSRATQAGSNQHNRSADQQEKSSERVINEGKEVEWVRLGGSDICMPKNLKKPLDGGRRINAVVHFVGGVFLGNIPKQTYRPFIEV